jgi:RNA polymerase sigma factor (sigma-70 family)
MAAGQVNRIVYHLRRLAHGRADRALSDGQLLEGFVSRRDESAFEELVRRHGPMVLGVCRRVLGNADDADDAFQATFMVLVRKARSVVPRELVGHWLYGVACRVALDARGRAGRRRAREKQVEDMPHPTTPAPRDPDLRPVLDRELSRLPDKYRVPVVLCDLEGRSRKEVARVLGLPEGTLSSRLAAARKMLAGRLARHGLPLGTAALAAALAADATQAAVPGPLAFSTVKAAAAGAASQAVALGLLSRHAAALTEGVMKAMLISKLKTLAAVVVTVGLLTTGAGVMTLTADEPRPGLELDQAKPPRVGPSGKPGVSNPAARPVIALEVGDEPKSDREIVEGFWKEFFGLGREPDAQANPTGKPADDKLQLRLRLAHPEDRDFLVFHYGQKVHSPELVDELMDALLRHAHNNPKYAESCTACHIDQKLKARSSLFQLRADVKAKAAWSGGDILIIRMPKKASPAGDREFLRRVCLDLLGRTPTLLEMEYFLADNDPQKHRKVVEKLVRQAPDGPVVVDPLGKPAAPPDRAALAEEYVKQKLGKKELSADERRLLRQVLEFTEKERRPAVEEAPAKK